MKTLVIHPKDDSTQFLAKIYKDRDWTLIDSKQSKRSIKEAIKSHDRIIMMGHGCEKGLFDSNFDTIIDSNYVYLLREKECIAIWCNADVFFLKYGLKGLYTGMIISEYDEAILESVTTTYNEIEESNLLFGNAIKEGISNEDFNIDKIQEIYSTDNLNRVMDFNKSKIYKT
jgi:hypothetical protein